MDDFTRDDILMGFNEGVIPRIWLTRCVAIMSSIGSFCIIRHSLKKTGGYDMGTYLVVLMSLSDLILSLLSHVIGTTMVPSGLVYGARGNRTTCIVQGYIGFFFGLLGPMINTALALYFLLLVKHGWKKEKFESYRNRFWFLLFPVLFSLIIMIVPLINGGISYNLGTTTCGVAPHPPGCNVNEEVFGKCKNLLGNNIMSAVFLLLLIIEGTVIAVSMIKLWIYVRKTEENSHRHDFQGTEHQRGQSTLIGKVGILYSASFFLTWIFWFINVMIFVILGSAPLFLKYLTATFISAQGFFNAFVYFYRIEPHRHQSEPVKKKVSNVSATCAQHISTTHRKDTVKIEDQYFSNDHFKIKRIMEKKEEDSIISNFDIKTIMERKEEDSIISRNEQVQHLKSLIQRIQSAKAATTNDKSCNHNNYQSNENNSFDNDNEQPTTIQNVDDSIIIIEKEEEQEINDNETIVVVKTKQANNNSSDNEQLTTIKNVDDSIIIIEKETEQDINDNETIMVVKTKQASNNSSDNEQPTTIENVDDSIIIIEKETEQDINDNETIVVVKTKQASNNSSNSDNNHDATLL